LSIDEAQARLKAHIPSQNLMNDVVLRIFSGACLHKFEIAGENYGIPDFDG